MISFLRGKPFYLGADYAVIDVQGIGYKVFMPGPSIQKLAGQENETLIHTYMHVREDAMLLFGFADDKDLKVFELLIQVSGVGPKVALAILSSLPGSMCIQAILQERLDMLTQIPGVGKKTAQRIIIELKDKAAKLEMGTDANTAISPENLFGTNFTEEALQALTALGYNSVEAKRVLNKIAKSEVNSHDTGELVRLALKELGKF